MLPAGLGVCALLVAFHFWSSSGFHGLSEHDQQKLLEMERARPPLSVHLSARASLGDGVAVGHSP